MNARDCRYAVALPPQRARIKTRRIVVGLLTLCIAALPSRGAAGPPAATPPSTPASPAITAAPKAAAQVANDVETSGLPTRIQERLRDRRRAITMAGDSTVGVAARYDGDIAVLQQLVGLGYDDVDTFWVPVTDAGSAVLIVRFLAKTDDEKAEAVSLFRQLALKLSATSYDFVAFDDRVGSPDKDAHRYKWLLWRTPTGDWVMPNGALDDYFETKLADLRTQPARDADLEVAYITRRAHIDFTRGKPRDGAARMREALGVIDAQPATRPIRAALQLRVLRALLYDAADDDNPEQLDAMIRRYAELGTRLNLALPNRPVRARSPRVTSGMRRNGAVRLEFEVREDGRVENLRVLHTDLPESYVERVKDAFADWRFLPAVQNGKAVRSTRRWTWRLVDD